MMLKHLPHMWKGVGALLDWCYEWSIPNVEFWIWIQQSIELLERKSLKNQYVVHLAPESLAISATSPPPERIKSWCKILSHCHDHLMDDLVGWIMLVKENLKLLSKYHYQLAKQDRWNWLNWNWSICLNVPKRRRRKLKLAKVICFINFYFLGPLISKLFIPQLSIN